MEEYYTPEAIIGIFNNAIKTKETVTQLVVKGTFKQGNNRSYGGYFYDSLYSENGKDYIKLKSSSVLRSKLSNNNIYTIKGFLEKKTRDSGIDITFVASEIIGEAQKSISEEDLKRLEVLQAKVEGGFKDIESIIRNKILNNEPISVANIYGTTAIVDTDFKNGLGVYGKFFEIDNYNCNITSSTAILSKLKSISNYGYDIIGIVRGGGNSQSFDAMNDVGLAQLFVKLNAVTITAIGHSVNETLLDKIADKSYNLPLDYGAGLGKIVDRVNEDKTHSRTQIIEEVKKDIGEKYMETIRLLEKQMKEKNEEIQNLNANLKEALNNTGVPATTFFVVLIIGFIIGSIATCLMQK